MSKKQGLEILEKGLKLDKCQNCICMKMTLESLKNFDIKTKDYIKKLKKPEHDCLGCEYCFPAEAVKSIK